MRNYSQLSFEDFVRITNKRKRWIITPVILFIIVGLCLIRVLPKYYVANTLVLVKSQKVQPIYIHAIVNSPIEERLKTIQEEVMSRSRLHEIITRFGLYGDLRDTHSTDQIIEKMRKNITVRILNDDAFAIYVEGKDPDIAAKVANAITDQFINANLRWRIEKVRETTSFLEDMLNDQQKILSTRETALAEFLKKHPGELPEHTERNLRLIEQLGKQIETKQNALKFAQDSKTGFERQIARLLEAELPSIELTSTDRHLQELKELEDQLSTLTLKYTDSHPQVILKKSEIDHLREMLDHIHPPEASLHEFSRAENVENKQKTGAPAIPNLHSDKVKELRQKLKQVTNEIENLEQSLVDIQDQIRDYHNRVENAPNLEVELKELNRQYRQEQKHHDELLAKYLDAQLALQLEIRQKGEQFITLDEAIPPKRPLKPNPLKIMLMSIFMSFGAGLVLAFTRDYFDRTFYDARDVEKTTGARVLASIPQINEIQASEKLKPFTKESIRTNHVHRLTGEEGAVTFFPGYDVPASIQEFYRILKVKIEQKFSHRNRCHSFLITSTVPQEGKTTTATHLAWILNQGLDKRVVLLECDFYKPQFSSRFHLPSTPGLSEYLSGDVKLKDVLTSVQGNRFSLIAAGKSPRKPEELLGSSRMADLMKKLKNDFDYIILDTPSIMSSLYETDTLTAFVDHILFIIRADHTPRQLAKHAVSLLDPSKLLGTVLNQASDIKRSAYERCVQYRKIS